MGSPTSKHALQLDQDDLFVVYRMPKQEDHYLIRHSDIASPKFEFVIHPFDKDGDASNHVIKSNELLTNQPFFFQTNHVSHLASTSQEDYMQMANRFIYDMEHKDYEKVVLSRIHQIDRGNIEISALFENLKSTYLNAFIYLINIPEVGTWMGATPEILMERDRDTIYTVALAATQKVDGRTAEEVRWNDKEIEEQAIIQRYVEHHLDYLKLKYSKRPTYTSQAGNVFHIKTVYEISDMQSTDQLVDQLHPGPAICGMPQSISKSTILSTEKHDRAFYCGYLGLKTAELTRLFINLRCMQVFKDTFALYIGGGLTADSTAESEWEETETKAKTLSTVIEKSYIYGHDVE